MRQRLLGEMSDLSREPQIVGVLDLVVGFGCP
jgi:hypothetical protein